MKNAAYIFSRNGPISTLMPGYEVRQPQITMAKAVEESIQKGGVLLTEAETGTGKTLAYLVPAILSNRPTVVSTGTKNLQEQIFFKDIEFLSQALDRPINAFCLKGQNNYLCIRRLRELERSPKVLSFNPETVAMLKSWSLTTATGDRMELEWLKDDHPLWREVCSTKDTRLGLHCPDFDACFFNEARKRTAQADLVIVNHHLYFADLATRQSGGAILPPHDIVVFDEAHLIEDIATEFFSISISSSKTERVLKDALIAVSAAKLRDDPADRRRPVYADEAIRAANTFFEKFFGPEGRSRLVPEEIDRKDTDSYLKLDSSIEALEQSLLAVKGMDPSVDRATERISELREELSSAVTKSKKGFVHWVENRRRSVVLGASPINISDLMREGVFFKVPTVVLSSATLTTLGSFDYLKSRLGLDFDIDEISVPSPFNFEIQARVYLPAHLPDPRHPDFTAHVAEESFKLIDLTGGGALLLFTSISNMEAVHGILKNKISNPLFLQGEAPKSTLLKRLMDTNCSVLLATDSFWQGVDIPGDALRLLIIDKLPFDSPSDPLVAARIADLQEKGFNPFTKYQVPRAALALKQGAGRLIRTSKDRGIIAVLDKRLHTMSYSKAFLESLPNCPKTMDFEEIKLWWCNPNEV